MIKTPFGVNPTFMYKSVQCSKTLIISEKTKITSKPESLLVGADDGT